MSAHFSIAARPVGGQVVVNGEDITDRVAAAHVGIGIADPTVLTLYLRADAGTIEGEGIVHVVEQLDGDPVDAICSFLAAIDHQQLEHEALLAHDGRSLTAVMLDVLASYARGGT